MNSKIKRNNLQAGRFSVWLQDYRNALLENGDMHVPCGECNACCRSSQFIHIGPRETHTLKHIPGKYLFPAPFSPKGYKVLGYNEHGCCPMLKNDKCSIYKYRPLTCRSFDCRVLTACGIKSVEKNYSLMMRQVRRWKFSYPSDPDRKYQSAVRSALKFLSTHRSSFPSGWVPKNPIQLAMLSAMACNVFRKINGSAHKNSEIVKKVLNESSLYTEHKNNKSFIRRRS